MAGKTILILGGGVGGIVTANALRKHLAPEHRIVVVDKRAEYVFTPSLLWLMVGWRQPKQITKDLRRLLRPSIEVMQAEVQEIDPDRAVVRADGSLSYCCSAVGVRTGQHAGQERREVIELQPVRRAGGVPINRVPAVSRNRDLVRRHRARVGGADDDALVGTDNGGCLDEPGHG